MKINPVVYIAIAVIVLGGLFFVFKPKTNQSSSTTQNNIANTQNVIEEQASEEASLLHTFELVVQGNKLISGPSTIKVNFGDEVTIKITSDVAEELHVHAYDTSVELEPGVQATLTFIAKMSGRFPFELEKSKTELGAIEVQPE